MSHNGTPMDGALVGAGSHDPSQVSPLAYQRTLVSARICLQERMDEKSERKKSLQVGAEKKKKAPPRFELGLLDSKSNVVTTRLWGQACYHL